MRGRALLISILTFALTIIGLIFVGSASSWISMNFYSDSFYMLKRQAIFALIGALVYLVCYFVPLSFWKKIAPYFFLFSLLLMGLLWTPLALVSGGSARWIVLAGFQFQPSELLKLGAIFFFSYLLSKPNFSLDKWYRWLAIFACLLISLLLVLLEPDIGSAGIILLVSLILFFLGLKSFREFSYIALPLLLILLFFVAFTPYAQARVASFLNPQSDPLNSGYNQLQAMQSFSMGGFWGKGLGMSLQKFSWLPQAYNDFIFSIIGEEAGFVGVLIVISLYAMFSISGFSLALACRQNFNKYLAIGITSLITIQALVHIAVCTGNFPITGITLPLISYGGTSLVTFLMACGILTRIAKEETIP